MNSSAFIFVMTTHNICTHVTYLSWVFLLSQHLVGLIINSQKEIYFLYRQEVFPCLWSILGNYFHNRKCLIFEEDPFNTYKILGHKEQLYMGAVVMETSPLTTCMYTHSYSLIVGLRATKVTHSTHKSICT